MGGFGSGAFFFGLLATQFVNPARESVESDATSSLHGYFKPDSAVVARVPLMFRMLALAYALLFLLGVACMTEPGEG
ncbi:hypothetical protein EON64_15400, partial [archaeon]